MCTGIDVLCQGDWCQPAHSLEALTKVFFFTSSAKTSWRYPRLIILILTKCFTQTLQELQMLYSVTLWLSYDPHQWHDLSFSTCQDMSLVPESHSIFHCYCYCSIIVVVLVNIINTVCKIVRTLVLAHPNLPKYHLLFRSGLVWLALASWTQLVFLYCGSNTQTCSRTNF